MQFKLYFLFFFLLSSSVFAQKQKFEIRGEIDQKFENKKIYFSRIKMYGSTAEPKAMPVSVENGKFLIKGELEEPEQGILSLNQNAKLDSNGLQFLIGGGVMQVTIDNDLPSAKVSGSAVNDEFKAYITKTTAATHEFNEFYELLKLDALKGKNRDSLQLVFENGYSIYRKEMNEIRLNYFKAHPASFVSLLLLPEIAEYSQDYKLTDSLYNSLSATVKSTQSAKIINDRLEGERKLAIGAIAPEFSQTGTDGKLIKLTDFRGKYVLVDFWASWCGPCRQENPNVVKIYNDYKGKNFTILGVSLDRPGSKAAWLKAISDDNLTWTHVSDLNFWKNEAALSYNVTSIPQNFLLDPQGRIIAKNLRGEDLKSALAEILK